MAWEVPDMWEGGECWIVGGGPSWLYDFDIPEEVRQAVLSQKKSPAALSPYLEVIQDKHIIGVNNAYQLGNWISILFFGDCAWYNVHRAALVNFPGLKITACVARSFSKKEHIRVLGRDITHKRGISTRKTKVSWNKNSGAASISVAAHLGVKRIILLGFDMAMDAKSKCSHFHGSHRRVTEPVKSPPFKSHLSGFPDIARDAKKMGIEIINTNLKSKIKDFPKVNIKELL